MWRVLITLVVASILLMGSLALPAAPAKAYFGERGTYETYGGCWNSSVPWETNCNGGDATVYAWNQSIHVWLFQELCTVFTCGNWYGIPSPETWLTLGYQQYYSQQPQHYHRFKPYEGGYQYYGQAEWSTFHDYTIMRMGSYHWYIFVNGGGYGYLTVPQNYCSLKGDVATYDSFGSSYGYFTDLQQLNGYYWDEWDTLDEDAPGWVMTYAFSDDAFYCYRRY